MRAGARRHLEAQRILDMQLQRLTGLERQKIVDELAGLITEIERLRAILSSRRLLMAIIVVLVLVYIKRAGTEELV